MAIRLTRIEGFDELPRSCTVLCKKMSYILRYICGVDEDEKQFVPDDTCFLEELIFSNRVA